MSRPFLIPAIVATCLTLTAGCGTDREDRAVTVQPSGSTGAASSSTSPAEAEAPEDSVERLLTEEEAVAALPKVNNLPTGWTTDPEGTALGDDGDDESTGTTSPERCAKVFDALESEAEAEPQVEEEAAFAKSALGPFLGVQLSSYEDSPDTDRYDDVAKALGECSTFSVTDEKGTTEFTAKPLSFPNLGDRTFAIRFTVTEPTMGMVVHMDMVVIAIGHNQVEVAHMTIGNSPDTAVTEKAARTVIAKLTA